MKREIKFQIIYANQIDGYERLIEKDGHIFWQWMCLEMNPANSEKWISGVYPKQYKYIRRQFTGLTDKNGKEIYEGDILISKYGDKKPFEILFGEYQTYEEKVGSKSTSIGFYWNETDGEQVGFGKSIDGNMDAYEVIGNVFENPELI
jgi:uncharacterized phage protein (TIGR01671 family)